MVVKIQVMVVALIYYGSIFVYYDSLYDLRPICIFHNPKCYLYSTFYNYRITFP